MPNRLQWEPAFDVGHDVIDAQHRTLLTHCERLADHFLCRAGEDRDRSFDRDFDRLKALVREHFDTEGALRVSLGDPDAEDHRIELEEFEYLAGEIMTTENFDRLELQRFVAFWCLGHITGSGAQLRAWLPGGDTRAAAAA